MSIRLGVVMDPIHTIKPWKDTTFAMLLEAQRRHWEVLYFTPGDLFVLAGEAHGRGRSLRVTDNTDAWYELGDESTLELASLDIILMRQDPPFDNDYLYVTYLLEMAESRGVLVANRP